MAANETYPGIRSKYLMIGQAVLLILAVITMNRWFSHGFPVWDYRLAQGYLNHAEQIKNSHAKDLQQFRLLVPKEESLAYQLPGTVIVVVGESANRDHHKAFNEAYPVDTTPWLSEKKKENNFYLFEHAYANYSITAQSLSMFLTGNNQYNGEGVTNAISVIDLANKAGYTTHWISNQDETGNVLLSVMSGNASFHKQLNPPGNDDMRVLNELKEIPNEGSHFIVIHLEGSHDRYKDRLPKDFSGIHIADHSEKVNEYDSSILYTDQVLGQIYTYAKDHLNLQVMLYCSDHGEDMTYFHGGSQFTFDMVRVPLWIYLSSQYQEKYSDVSKSLGAHTNFVFTNDLVYDTVSGLLRVPNNEYERKYDLSSADYGITVQNAITMHGKKRIADDPNYP